MAAAALLSENPLGLTDSHVIGDADRLSRSSSRGCSYAFAKVARLCFIELAGASMMGLPVAAITAITNHFRHVSALLMSQNSGSRRFVL
jgi:hypothetical protein